MGPFVSDYDYWTPYILNQCLLHTLFHLIQQLWSGKGGHDASHFTTEKIKDNK